MPGVQVLAEDQEAAVEVVERVLRSCGVAGSVVAGVVSDARKVPEQGGAPSLPPVGVTGALALEAQVLETGDWAVGRTLSGLALRSETGTLAVAIRRAGVVSAAPSPEQVLEDIPFLVGARERLEAAMGRLRGDRSLWRAAPVAQFL